jgi:hypothetical protein
MTIIQKTILIITSSVLFFGSLAIIFIGSFNLVSLLIFWIIVVIVGRLLFQLFKEPEEETMKERPQPSQPKSVQSVQNQNPVLFSTKTYWPYDPFPDNLVIQEKTISFFRKNIFSSGVYQTIPVNKISGSVIYIYPGFAVLTINVKEEEAKAETTHNFPLKKDVALQAKEILDGLVLKEQNIINFPPAKTVEEKKQGLEKATKNKEIEEEIKK